MSEMTVTELENNYTPDQLAEMIIIRNRHLDSVHKKMDKLQGFLDSNTESRQIMIRRAALEAAVNWQANVGTGKFEVNVLKFEGYLTTGEFIYAK